MFVGLPSVPGALWVLLGLVLAEVARLPGDDHRPLSLHQGGNSPPDVPVLVFGAYVQPILAVERLSKGKPIGDVHEVAYCDLEGFLQGHEFTPGNGLRWSLNAPSGLVDHCAWLLCCWWGELCQAAAHPPELWRD